MISSHNFSEPAFATVAHNGATDLLRNCNPVAAFISARLQNECGKERCVKPLALIVNPAELLTVSQYLGLVGSVHSK